MAHDQAVVDKALGLYRERPDMSTKAIARECKVAPSTIVSWAASARIKNRPRGRRPALEPNAKQRRVLELVETHTMEQVGALVGMTKQGVWRIVRDWKGWQKPKHPPFVPGDILLWEGRKYTVLAAGLFNGTVKDNRTRQTIINFHWTAKKKAAVKVGHNPEYAAPSTNGHAVKA